MLTLQQQLLYPVIAAAIAGLSAYVDMSLGEFVRLVLLGCFFQFVYSVVTAFVAQRLIEPIVQWQRGA
ncbi:MAG: hypothetical protein ABR581_00220, partial [Thermoleophilaceae bacterium]